MFLFTKKVYSVLSPLELSKGVSKRSGRSARNLLSSTSHSTSQLVFVKLILRGVVLEVRSLSKLRDVFQKIHYCWDHAASCVFSYWAFRLTQKCYPRRHMSTWSSLTSSVFALLLPRGFALAMRRPFPSFPPRRSEVETNFVEPPFSFRVDYALFEECTLRGNPNAQFRVFPCTWLAHLLQVSERHMWSVSWGYSR
jgi:hypothetical protein